MSVTDGTDNTLGIHMPLSDAMIRNGVPMLTQLARLMKSQNDALYRKTGPRRSLCFPDPDYAPLATLTAKDTWDEFSCGTASPCDFQLPFYFPPGNGRLHVTMQIATPNFLDVEWRLRFQIKTMLSAQTTLTSGHARANQGPGIQLALWRQKAQANLSLFAVGKETVLIYEYASATIDASTRSAVIVPQVQWTMQGAEWVNTTVTRRAKLVGFAVQWTGMP